MPTDITEYRHNRNFVRVGDWVRCYPTVGRSFEAIVTRITLDEPLGQIEVEVVGGKPGHREIRTFRVHQIKRVSQARKEREE